MKHCGIAIDFIQLYFAKNEIGNFTKLIIYTFSILIPIVIIIIEKIDSNVFETLDSVIARIYILFGNTKAAKMKLLQILDKNSESYIAHKLLQKYMKKKAVKEKQ